MTSKPTTDETGVPAFGRVEIALASREDIRVAANHLASLASALTQVAASDNDDDAARLLAYRKIRLASSILRPGKHD